VLLGDLSSLCFNKEYVENTEINLEISTIIIVTIPKIMVVVSKVSKCNTKPIRTNKIPLYSVLDL